MVLQASGTRSHYAPSTDEEHYRIDPRVEKIFYTQSIGPYDYEYSHRLKLFVPTSCNFRMINSAVNLQLSLLEAQSRQLTQRDFAIDITVSIAPSSKDHCKFMGRSILEDGYTRKDRSNEYKIVS